MALYIHSKVFPRFFRQELLDAALEFEKFLLSRVPKQGPKLSANQAASRLESIHAAILSKEADARKLKGEERLSWMLKNLKRDIRTDERQLRRILANSRNQR